MDPSISRSFAAPLGKIGTGRRATDKAKDIRCSTIRLAGGGAIDAAAKEEVRYGALIEVLGGALGPIGIGQGYASLEFVVFPGHHVG